VFEAAIWVYVKIMIENQKKRESMEIEDILHKCLLKDRLKMKFTSQLAKCS